MIVNQYIYGKNCLALARCNQFWHTGERLVLYERYNYNELRFQYTIVEKYHRHILWVVVALLFAMEIFTTSVSLQQGNIGKTRL